MTCGWANCYFAHDSSGGSYFLARARIWGLEVDLIAVVVFSTRVLRLPGFANKKYDQDFYVQVRTESTQTYHLRDFKLQFNSQDAPRHQHEEVARKPLTENHTLSQSAYDWAFARRALARGDNPTEVIRRIADYRADDKHDPEYYARHTVQKALASIQQRFTEENGANERATREIDRGDSP